MPKPTKVIYQGPTRFFKDLGRLVHRGDEIPVSASEAADHPDLYQPIKGSKKPASPAATKED